MQINSAALVPKDSFIVVDFRSFARSSHLQSNSFINELNLKGLALIDRESEFNSNALGELLSNEDEEMTKDIDELESYASPKSQIDRLGPQS